MGVQQKAFSLFLGITAVIVAVFFVVMRSTGKPRDVAPPRAAGLRRQFAFLCGLALLAALALTLLRMPYPKAGELPEKVVFVVGKQFSFGISETPIETDAQWEAATSSKPVRIPAGALTEFRVTSFDVNHGFAVYSSSGELLAQTQAMPGYVNRLRLRLERPGRYAVLCLELCGMEHHEMRGALDVQ